jgi:hypothetical protein
MCFKTEAGTSLAERGYVCFNARACERKCQGAKFRGDSAWSLRFQFQVSVCVQFRHSNEMEGIRKTEPRSVAMTHEEDTKPRRDKGCSPCSDWRPSRQTPAKWCPECGLAFSTTAVSTAEDSYRQIRRGGTAKFWGGSNPAGTGLTRNTSEKNTEPWKTMRSGVFLRVERCLALLSLLG